MSANDRSPSEISNGIELSSHDLFPCLASVNSDDAREMDPPGIFEHKMSYANQMKRTETQAKKKTSINPCFHTKQIYQKKYKKKYQRLRKLAKRIIFENAAIADEIVQTDAKFQQVKLERRFLLKKLLDYNTMLNEQVLLPPCNFTPHPVPDVVEHFPAPEADKELAPVITQTAKTKPIKLRIKKTAANQKSKKDNEKAFVAKENVEDSSISEVSRSQDIKGEPPVKPKRKKPGTAMKRKVQPIPVDAKGKPVFPIILGGLTVHSLGDIVWDRPGFHSERYIWPVGFCSSRYYPSMKTPDTKCIYTCKILDGGYGPTFVMSPEDDSENSIEASSATACHCVILKAINKARGKEATNTGSGPEFFGFSHPTIQYLLQSLPNARKCSKYQWVKFELPKTKLLGKLGSNPVPNDDVSLKESQENEKDCYDSGEIFKGRPSNESQKTMHNLSFTSTASSLSDVPSLGFDADLLDCQLKSTSGDPSLDLGTPISPPGSLSLPLQLSPKMNSNMSPSTSSQPCFIPPTSPLFHFGDDALTD